MNIKTELLEDYVNFVETTKKQNKKFILTLILFVVLIILFYLKITQSSICKQIHTK